MLAELHPQAAESYNKTADKLLTELKPRSLSQARTSFRPDVHISANLGSSDIKEPVRSKQSIVDLTGEEIGRVIGHGGNEFVLDGESYSKLLNLLSSMQTRCTVLSLVSMQSLLDSSFAWIEDRLSDKSGLSYSDHVVSHAEKEIQTFELWIPVYSTHIEFAITIGEVTFETITRQMLDEDEQRLIRKSPKDAARIKEYINKERQLFQGTVAAKVILRAERLKAFELARQKAEDAVAVLRFLSPANLSPKMKSHCTVLGAENVIRTYALEIIDHRIIGSTRGVLTKSPIEWVLSLADLADFPGDLVGRLNQLAMTTRSPFQQSLYEALLIYSRNSLAVDASDKLVFILVALESLLLRGSEPIQKNIAERMAFLIAHDLPSRKQVIANALKTYGMRSSFIHHGHGIADLEVLATFMVNVWTCFYSLLFAQEQFQKKDDLITKLEDMKLS